MKRRGVLLSGLGLAGALVVGWGVLPPRSRIGSAGTLPSADGVVGLNGWLRIAADGGVELAMNRSEMGQGVHTALAMMVAEELDVSLDRVRLINLMLGRELEQATAHGRTAHDTGEELLRAKGLGRRGRVAPFDLTIRARGDLQKVFQVDSNRNLRRAAAEALKTLEHAPP